MTFSGRTPTLTAVLACGPIHHASNTAAAGTCHAKYHSEAIVDYVCEIAGSLKVGKCMPGTGIPVVEESRLFSDQPECAIIFSWHIADELAPKLRQKGYRGKLITPLPVPREL